MNRQEASPSSVSSPLLAPISLPVRLLHCSSSPFPCPRIPSPAIQCSLSLPFSPFLSAPQTSCPSPSMVCPPTASCTRSPLKVARLGPASPQSCHDAVEPTYSVHALQSLVQS
ncbi:hypothetical protein LY76DRAFT_241313 [Colletotrichum caudatum]|nr:hypothetical protein LY76DRAFT_241313 [Colletotrichum caudatum]